MIHYVALLGVQCAALYLLLLGLLALIRPAQASTFLLGFASTAPLHYLELIVRILIGACFVVAAPTMALSPIWVLSGWVLIATSVALLLVPWQWHQRFARFAVPRALPFLSLIGVCSILAGSLLLGCLWMGAAT